MREEQLKKILLMIIGNMPYAICMCYDIDCTDVNTACNECSEYLLQELLKREEPCK
jgi:hypothetical protein